MFNIKILNTLYSFLLMPTPNWSWSARRPSWGIWEGDVWLVMSATGSGGNSIAFHASVQCGFHKDVHDGKPLSELEKEVLI